MLIKKNRGLPLVFYNYTSVLLHPGIGISFPQKCNCRGVARYQIAGGLDWQTLIFCSSQQVTSPSLGPLMSSLSWHCGPQGSSTSTRALLPGLQIFKDAFMCVALDVEVPGPSSTTDTNLHSALVDNALFLLLLKFGSLGPPWHPLTDLFVHQHHSTRRKKIKHKMRGIWNYIYRGGRCRCSSKWIILRPTNWHREMGNNNKMSV